MARFSEQLRSALSAHNAVNALEARARDQIDQALDDWDAGILNAVTVRYRLERIVRNAYRGSVALAAAQARRQADLPDWTPRERVFVTPYLSSLLADVRRNLREFKQAGRTPEARRRAAFRMKHSAGVAAQRGYTDALEASAQEMQEFGLIVRKVWRANFIGNQPCPQCVGLHGAEVDVGQQFPVGDYHAPYIDLLGPPAHPHCFPAGVLVSAVDVTGATARIFDGDVVIVRTRSGKELTATPNHPVLTRRGWVPAGLLVEGDQVVSTRLNEWVSGVHQDDRYMPALIEEVAESLLCSGEMTTTEVPVAAEDFHGDGGGSDVARVGADSLLLNHIQPQHGDDDVLQCTDAYPALLTGRCYGLSVFPGVRPAPDSVVSGLGAGAALLSSRTGGTEQARLTDAAWLDASLQEPVPDSAPGGGKSLRDALLSLPREVTLDDVVHVERQAFHGMVYNLESRLGWYIVNGIVTHNCQCWLTLLVVTLENAFDSVDLEPPEEDVTSMTSAQVRSMPAALYASFVRFLATFLRRRARR